MVGRLKHEIENNIKKKLLKKKLSLLGKSSSSNRPHQQVKDRRHIGESE
jgi:hypothetical protein